MCFAFTVRVRKTIPGFVDVVKIADTEARRTIVPEMVNKLPVAHLLPLLLDSEQFSNHSRCQMHDEFCAWPRLVFAFSPLSCYE